MGDYSFGTPGFWRFMFCMACLGILTAATGAVAGVVWIITHLWWSP